MTAHHPQQRFVVRFLTLRAEAVDRSTISMTPRRRRSCVTWCAGILPAACARGENLLRRDVPSHTQAVGPGRFGAAHDRTSAPSSGRECIHPASPADQVVRLRGADSVRVHFFARRSTAWVRRSTPASVGSKGPPTHSSLSPWSSWSGSAIASRNAR